MLRQNRNSTTIPNTSMENKQRVTSILIKKK